MKQRVISSLDFECVSVIDVEKIVKNLASKNSSGHDGISARFFKSILKTVVLPLTHVINQSLSTGIFPDRLKIPRVVPLFKKGDQHIPDNYRPISLLPVVYKVFGKVIFNQLYQYVTDINLILPVSTASENYIPRNLCHLNWLIELFSIFIKENCQYLYFWISVWCLTPWITIFC